MLTLASAVCAEVVQLNDGQLIRGKIIEQNDKQVVVRNNPSMTTRIDRRSIAGIYKDGEKIPPPPPGWDNPPLPPKGGWPRPYPTITTQRDDEIAAMVSRVVAASQPAERARMLAAASQADRPSLPSAATVEHWLASPRLYPAAANSQVEVKLPWAGENPRAIMLLGVPKDYDPRTEWPLIIALHGTDDTPTAIFSWWRTANAPGRGYFVAAPRTLHRAHLWYNPADQENIARIIGYLADNYRIDPRRIIVMGGSGGGMGTWGLAALHPELFSAGASSAGMPAIQPNAVFRLRTMPLFIMHGVKDHIPVAGPRRMHEAMEKLKIAHVYFEHDGGHYPTREQWAKLHAWMFATPRKPDCSPRPAIIGFSAQAAAAKPLPAPPPERTTQPE